ncbi:MAG: hypothetical protein AAFU67_08900, partial [Bacteroidota bacterium]
GGSAELSVSGINHLSFSTSQIRDGDFLELPVDPIPGSLYLRMDYGLLFLENQTYTLSGRFINWIEDIPPPGGGLIDLDIWYAY